MNTPTLPNDVSKKMRFFAFVSMLVLVYVHGYNLNDRYLQPFSPINEPLTFTTFFEYYTANGLVRFRIPMLFVISGYLYALHDYKPNRQRIGKRFRTLMVPYFLWSIIGLLVAYGLWHWSWTHDAVYNAHLQPSFEKNFDQYNTSDWISALLWPTPFQLWFIRCLFFYNLLYPVLRWLVLKVPGITFTIFSIAWILLLGFVVIEGEGLLFFTLGIWLCKREKNVQQMPRWFSLKWAVPVLLLLCAFKTLWAFYGMQYLKDLAYGLPLVIMHKIVVGLGLLVAWFVFDKVAIRAMQTKWFASASAYSFIIYALHVPLITYIIDPTLRWFQPFALARLTHYIVIPFAVILFCIAIGWLLRKTVPSVYSLLTGGRGM